EGRPPFAGIVASLGRLDLDDLGAHIAEHHGAEGASQDAGQIEHGDPGERGILAHGYFLRMEGGALRSLAQPSRCVLISRFLRMRNCWKSGLRPARKAFMPSRLSSEPQTW